MATLPGSNLFDLTGQIALVTGAAKGIGKALAIGLAQHGADVVVVNRATSRQETEDVAAQIRQMGRRAWPILQDLSRIDELDRLAATVWEQAGRVDILVNNAGLAYSERYEEISPEHWRQVMSVNLDAVFFLTRAVVSRMIAQGIKGRVINVSSTNGHCAEAGQCHYNASKGGLELLTQSLAIELGEHGITVNTICPGIIETEILRKVALANDYISYFKEHVPLEHRLGQPEECVGPVVLMASRAGSYITGQHLIIDGGMMCQQVPRLPFLPPAPPVKNAQPAGAGSSGANS